MNTIVRCLLLTVALAAPMIPATVSAQNDGRLRIDLSGFNEVLGPNLGIGTIFSTGSGRLTLKINKQIRSIDYELTYAFPDAAATPTVGAQFVNQAHAVVQDFAAQLRLIGIPKAELVAQHNANGKTHNFLRGCGWLNREPILPIGRCRPFHRCHAPSLASRG